MDIDAQLSGYDFSSTFPLPFRVLFLSFSTLFAFATNLHLLAHLGIDTSLVLDIRLDDYRATSTSNSNNNSRTQTPFVHPSRLYPPIYGLAVIGLAWTAVGWMLFSWVTGGDPVQMVRWRGIPAFVALVVGGATVAPINTLYRKERFMFLRALRRTILSPLYSAVPFSDIILADILTSSAKVLGDVWVSGCLLLTATERFGMGGGDTASGCGRVWMVPVMTSLPYVFRFRQCISEVVTGSTPTPRKSVMNAIKYASAFPVILFSALQTIAGDPYHDAAPPDASRWLSRDLVFTLWVLSVLVNSLYSFWWDVTNDWGLSLLSPGGWSDIPSISFAFSQPSGARFRTSPRSSPLHGRVRSNNGNTNISTSPSLSAPTGDFSAPLPSRPHSPENRGSNSPSKSYHLPLNNSPRSSAAHSRAYSTAATPNLSFPFLRPILLLPDPLVYYLAIAIDLILRFTWSLKLSSHLHTLHEIESGIFLMEALEVVRRWMWVYLRMEWEAVRKGGGGTLDLREGENRLRLGMEEEEIELGRRDGKGGYREMGKSGLSEEEGGGEI